jgi:hypothetical protein
MRSSAVAESAAAAKRRDTASVYDAVLVPVDHLVDQLL